MLEILILSLYIGLASATINIIVRNVWFVERWMLAGKKPWVCDVCMTLWTSAGITIAMKYVQGEWRAPLAWLPAYTIGLWTLGKLSRPLSAPPSLPEDHHGPMAPFEHPDEDPVVMFEDETVVRESPVEETRFVDVETEKKP